MCGGMWEVCAGRWEEASPLGTRRCWNVATTSCPSGRIVGKCEWEISCDDL